MNKWPLKTDFGRGDAVTVAMRNFIDEAVVVTFWLSDHQWPLLCFPSQCHIRFS